MTFDLIINKLVISTNISRLIVADSIGFWSVRVILDSEWDGLNKKLTCYNDSVAKDVLIPENGIIKIPHEVLTPGAELKFTVSGYSEDGNKILHTKEMFSSIIVCAAGKYMGDNPENYTPELWEQVMAKLNANGCSSGGNISVDQTYNPTSENAVSGKALNPMFQKKIEAWQPNTEYKRGDYVVANVEEDDDGIYAIVSTIMLCTQDHTSPDVNFPNNAEDFYDCWSVAPLYAYSSFGASCDDERNRIVDTYATKKELEDISTNGGSVNALRVWGIEKLYKVGDYVILNGTNATYIYCCNTEHIAEEFKPEYWDSDFSITTYHSEYANKALRDYDENIITEHYATKQELKTVASQVSSGLKREIVATLPDVSKADENTIYMVVADEAQTNNLYEEYLVINGAYELIGSTAVDLTDYVTKSYFNDSLGDIENALNEIINLQNTIIGG